MKTRNSLNFLPREEIQNCLTDLVERSENTCKNCSPITPLTCITRCETWKVKRQFRKLYEESRDPLFMVKLFNVLKNKRRLQLLKMISKDRYSLKRLQQKLKEKGFSHSKRTILKEYVDPLTTVVLAEEYHGSYYATIFGISVNELMEDFQDVDKVLSRHSECYEEAALLQMLRFPNTCEDLKSVIPGKSLPRILSRLRRAGLITGNEERSYIFFFKTKRIAKTSELSSTEKRVHASIPASGIPARSIAKKAGISLRRTYKYLRKLKGKKLVFVRKRPMSYRLTDKGMKKAKILEAIRDVTTEYVIAATGMMKYKEDDRLPNSCAVPTNALLEETG